MSNEFELGLDDVVSIKNEHNRSVLLKTRQLTFAMAYRAVGEDYAKAWTESGLECEVLMAGKGWQKGRVRLSLHFVPDEPESPLDDLRSSLNI